MKTNFLGWSVELLKNPMIVLTKKDYPYTQYACGWYFVYVNNELTRKFRWGRS
jgi:hypothetical protein